MLYFYMMNTASLVVSNFRFVLLLMSFALLGSCGFAPPLGEDGMHSCKTVRIQDGDSVIAQCDGAEVELRLACVDAPELSQ